MANGDVDVTEGTGLKVGTYTISEDAVTRNLQRIAVNTSAGVEVDLAAAVTSLGVLDNAISGSEMQVDVVGALPAGTNNIGDVDVLSLPALAAGTNNIGDVDVLTINGVAPAFGAGALGATVQRVTVATDDTVATDLTAIRTAAQILDNAISGSEMQVDVVAALPAGTNNIGDVDVLTIAAGETHLGEVGGKTISKSVTLSTDTAAYASGDLIADTQQIDAFFRKADGTGIIQSLTIVDEEAQGVAMYVLFHKTSTSMGTENSAPNISDANASAGIQGIVAIATTDWVTVSGTKICSIRNIGLPVIAAAGTDDLYISVLNSTGTPDWDADSLVMHIGALLD